MKTMISVAEAHGMIAQECWRLAGEEVLLLDGLERVLCGDVFAPINMPGFAQSAMDGYALNWEGYLAFGELAVVGEVAAGAAEALPRPATNEAVRIFTGAPLPEGFDTVVMQEKVVVALGVLNVIDDGLVKGKNVRTVGSEIAEGDLALAKGTVLTAAGIGFLASLGITHVSVVRDPKIAIIVTGDELQKPGVALTFGQVYESNSQLLQAALLHLRFSQPKIYYAKDDLLALSKTLQEAMEDSDLVLLTGGVSVGDYDFVLRAAEQCGVNGVFHKIKQKPGKPLFFGKYNGDRSSVVFGLPGNPGSVLSCFYLYVLPALQQLTNRPVALKKTSAIALNEYPKNSALTHFLKGVYLDGAVRMLNAQESFRLSSFSVANCLIEIPESSEGVNCNDSVTVYLFGY